MGPQLAWHAEAVDDVLVALGTSRRGLSAQDAARRLAEHGPNLLSRARRVSSLELVTRQFKNPLALVLLGSGLLAFALGSTTDGVVVLAVVVLNALIGAMQELRAAHAIDALDALVPEYATVIRDDDLVQISAAELVTGDLVLLSRGARVPADLRLMHATNAQVSELALTGESVPTVKQVEPVPGDTPLADRSSMLYSGTILVSGTAHGIVVATGGATELGRISTMLRTASKPETPIVHNLAEFGKRLTKVICGVALVIFYVAYERGFPLYDAVRAGVSLACASIPVGLPATVTIALAVAVRRMAARNAIVRTLPSIETLGSTSIICTDKTGTLTVGEMTVRRMWASGLIHELAGVGYAPTGELRAQGTMLVSPPSYLVELARAGMLCNDAVVRSREGAWTGIGSSTEIALVVAAMKLDVDVDAERGRWRRLDTIPFDSTTRCMVTLHEAQGGNQLVIVKGAPEVVLARCQPDADSPPVDIAIIMEMVDLLAASGMRVIAVAAREGARAPGKLASAEPTHARLLGLLGLVDPPRPEVIEAIAACHGAGIRIKMVTGDHPATARAIGSEIGLIDETSRVLTGADIDRMTRIEFFAAAEDVDLFARVEPEHKLRLVQALQTAGKVVAMTGDGVNDAPALKQADVGVAMGLRGTASAREASDMILVDDNFASIAAAVEEGRRCFENLMKVLIFLVPTSVGQGLVTVIGVLLFPIVDGIPLMPIIPLQILWVNFVTGVTLALPLAWESADRDVMRRRPRIRDRSIFGRELIVRCVLVGVLMALGAAGLFLWRYDEVRPFQEAALALRKAQTMAVTTVVLFQMFYLFQCRSLRVSVFELDAWSNPSIYLGVLATLAMQAVFVHARPMHTLFHSASLEPRDWALCALVAAVVLPLVSAHKHGARKASLKDLAV